MEVDDDERMNEERVVDESFASVDSPSFPLQISTSTSAMASVDYRTMAASAGMSQVIIRDPCNPSRDGMFPIDEAKLAEQHRWKFVEWYPRCCLGCSINGAYPVQGGPSGYALIAEPEDITSPVADAKPQPTSDEALSEDEVEDRIFLEDLPDVVLLRIIEYVHPVERVHNISVLSKRWNRLVKSHTLWREVRIFICDPPYYKNSVAEFLHRMGPWIEKLCISISCTEPFTERQFIDLFPSVMPSVKLLDIGFFSKLTVDLLYFLMRCFPNVERLNLEGVKKVDQGVFGILFLKGFENLRELVLSHCESMTADEYGILCAVNRPLEVLSVDGNFKLHNLAGTYLVSSPFALSLTRLYLDGEEFDDLGFRALTCCRNLKLLSVSFCESATDLSLGYVKTLPKIEHLHLRKGREFTCEGFRKFFEYSETNGAQKDNEFPSRLKFLNLGECPAVNDVIVDLITTNCTGLQSLCLVWCWSVTEVGLGMIVQRLNDLRLLDIRGLDCIDGSAFLDVPDLYLTNLRYLGAEQCPRIEDSTLQILNLRKKDLIISNYHNYFITFTINNGDATFMERYDNEFHAAVNEQLSRIDGFCCLSDIR